jgi:hypothetical protein
MFPIAIVIYVAAMISFIDEIAPIFAFLWANIIVACFVAYYWIKLWHKTVRWTRYRIIGTGLSAIGCLVIGIIFGTIVGSFMRYDEGEFTVFIAGILTILLWLVATILLWRETPAERAERVKLSADDAIFCLKCGYNMTGMHESRCPECGTKYTVDQLLAGQSQQSAKETTT